MIATRRQIHRPLCVSVFIAYLLGSLVVSGIAVTASFWLPLGAMYQGKAVILFMSMMAIVSLAIGHYHPFPQFGFANYITMFRAMLVALIASLLGESLSSSIAAVAVSAAFIMAILDGVDGWFARRSQMTSRFGARFDMETDALFIMVMSVLVWQYGKAGIWVILGGALRYAFIAAGYLLPWMAHSLRSTSRAKTVTVCHMVGLSIALAPFVQVPFSSIAVGITLIVLSWSFAVDVRSLRKRRGSDVYF